MTMWDDRYTTDTFLYGTEPNDFLREHVHRLPSKGRILCLAEGEGRNGVFLAKQGYDIVAVDSSKVGLAKALSLAESQGVKLTTEVADLAHYKIEENSYDGVISIFCHTPPDLRKKLHKSVVAGLKPGGVLILEGYNPKQHGRGTGGPPSPELMMDLHMLQDDFHQLEMLWARELEREVHEGILHNGLGAVVQVIARKV